jgi:kynureninase
MAHPEIAALQSRAEELDAHDPLAHARDRFVLPFGQIYLDGNSLGAQPASVAPAVTPQHSFVQIDENANSLKKWVGTYDDNSVAGGEVPNHLTSL